MVTILSLVISLIATVFSFFVAVVVLVLVAAILSSPIWVTILIVVLVLKNKKKNEAAASNAVVEGNTEATQKKSDNLEELKKYKDLLDSGAITQEEYDAKKKQLLDI